MRTPDRHALGGTTVSLTVGHLAVALLAIAAVASVAVAAFAARHRREPGATPFALLMGSLAVWSSGYAVALLVRDPALRVALEGVQWVGTAPIHVWLLLFALAYTGHDEFVTRRLVAVLGVVPVVTLALVWTNPVHHLMWAEPTVMVVDGVALVELPYGPAFWAFTAYTYGVVAVAAALLLRLVFVSDYLYADQSALLVLGIATPFAANVLDNFIGPSGPAVDSTPLVFTVTGLAFGYAVFRRRLFDLVPATRQLGRNAAVSQLDAGIVIVDNARRVVYCNAAAGEVFDVDPSDALDRPTDELVDESRLDFDAADALAEVERDGRTYEIRTSPVTDRHDRRIGHTIVVHDVTARARRERALAAQRDELARLDDLNATIRGVNQALVSATSRAEIEREVCERVVEADRYATACVGDIQTWTADADRWLVAGRGAETDGAPPDVDTDLVDDEVSTALNGDDADAEQEAAAEALPAVDAADGGSWVVVPLAYGRTVYGALGLYTESEVTEREREILGELGETIGLAVDAVETQQLLSADSVVELDLETADTASPLVAASTDTPDGAALGGDDAVLEVAGLVPGDDGHSAYVRVIQGDPTAVQERLEDATTGDVRTVRDGDEGDALFEWGVTGDSLLGALADRGAQVRRARADGGHARVGVEVASESDLRTLLDRIEGPFPDTTVVSKRERARSPDAEEQALSEEGLADLTDRQREVIEVAYRSGYFNWPRDSTAEEVAESLDISSPTLHSHLRQAEQSLLADLFEPELPEK